MNEKPPAARKAARFESPKTYRAYQRRVAREALLPVFRRLGVSLSGKSVLDLGCGTGGMCEIWGECGAAVVGADLDAHPLEGAGGPAVAADVAALPFRDGAFDLVVAHDLLEHVADLSGALRETARVLGPGGVAFVSFPPFRSAFGGHQQGAPGPVRFLPFGHLLPRRLWLSLAPAGYAGTFDGLSRLSMSAFEREAARSPLSARRRLSFLLRPEAALRLGVPAVECSFLGGVGVVREFLVGGAYYLLEKPA